MNKWFMKYVEARYLRFALLAFALLCSEFRAVQAGNAPTDWQPISRKTALKEHPDPGLKALVGGWFSKWLHGQKGSVVVHALDEKQLAETLREAHYYQLILQERLGFKPERSLHVVAVSDRSRWHELLPGARGHGKVRAFFRNGVIYIFRPMGPTPDRDLSDLSHELLHAMVHAAEIRWPLWLEEGLALHWGETLAKKYFSLQGRYVKTQTALGHLHDVDPRGFEHYPTNAQGAQAFYRSCKRWVQALDEVLNESQLASLLQRMANPDATLTQALESVGVSWEQYEKTISKKGQ